MEKPKSILSQYWDPVNPDEDAPECQDGAPYQLSPKKAKTPVTKSTMKVKIKTGSKRINKKVQAIMKPKTPFVTKQHVPAKTTKKPAKPKTLREIQAAIYASQEQEEEDYFPVPVKTVQFSSDGDDLF